MKSSSCTKLLNKWFSCSKSFCFRPKFCAPGPSNVSANLKNLRRQPQLFCQFVFFPKKKNVSFKIRFILLLDEPKKNGRFEISYFIGQLRMNFSWWKQNLKLSLQAWIFLKIKKSWGWRCTRKHKRFSPSCPGFDSRHFQDLHLDVAETALVSGWKTHPAQVLALLYEKLNYGEISYEERSGRQKTSFTTGFEHLFFGTNFHSAYTTLELLYL